MEYLATLGYTTVSFESGFGVTEITNSDIYLESDQLLTPFQSEFVNLTPFQMWNSNVQYGTHRKRIYSILDQLQTNINPNHASFVFAHILSPHPPFVFGPDGEEQNPDTLYSLGDGDHYTDIAGSEEYKRRYIDQVIYINKLLEKKIDEILADQTRKKIIIIQADHGPGSELNWESIEDTNMDERMGILNAYYFPDRDYSILYDGITPVNSFRVVLDQYLGTNLDLVEDRSYFSLLSRPYDFMDVTD